MAQRDLIVVVEDDGSYAEVLKLSLEKEGFEVLVCASAVEALSILPRHTPRALVIDRDLDLPGGDETDRDGGVRLLQAVRAGGELAHLANVYVAMLTHKSSEDEQLEVLDGAAKPNAYLCKAVKTARTAAKDISAALACLKGEVAKPQTFGPLTLDTITQGAFVDDKQLTLTPTEFKLLKVLVERPRVVLSREQLQSLVWPATTPVENRAIDQHVCSLRRKLGDTARKMIVMVRNSGYRFDPEALQLS